MCVCVCVCVYEWCVCMYYGGMSMSRKDEKSPLLLRRNYVDNSLFIARKWDFWTFLSSSAFSITYMITSIKWLSICFCNKKQPCVSNLPYGSLYFLNNQIHVQIKCENLIKWKVWLKWRNKALHVYKHTS